MKERLLSFVLAVLMIATLLPATALAADIVDSGTCGAEGDGSNLTWTLNSDGVLKIEGSGKMEDYMSGEYDTPWCNYNRQIQEVSISAGVTYIGEDAFNDCYRLSVIHVIEGNSEYSSDASGVLLNCDKTEILFCPKAFSGEYIVADGVTSIAEGAFSGCNSLTGIFIADGVVSIGTLAFYRCSSLTSVIIPDGLTTIGNEAFSSCGLLTSVEIPASVTSIGESAFTSCDSLAGIWVNEGNEYYSSDASGVLFNKDKTTLVQCPGAFKAYAIPSCVTSIGDDAFYGCSSLVSATIPDSVTSIGDRAFVDCTSLESVTIPNGVTSIGGECFRDCTSLASVTIPNSVTGIFWGVFHGCSSLTSVTIPDSVTLIDNGAFSYCSSLTSVTIPDSVTSIGDWAFSYCTSLTDVYYAGSEAQWKAISISSNGNDDLLTANIHYNYVSHTHSYKDVVTAPTCTEKGYTTHTCSCGDSYVDTYVDALGHAWDNGKVTKEPTETETGVKTFTCTRCGETKTEVIPATGVVASGTCGAEGDGSNLTWALDSEGLLTISGTGAMKEYDPYKAP